MSNTPRTDKREADSKRRSKVCKDHADRGWNYARFLEREINKLKSEKNTKAPKKGFRCRS